MKLDETNISKMSDAFIATFLSVCLENKIPFMDVCLGFVHASRKVLVSMVKLNMLTEKQKEVIEKTLTDAVEKDISSEESKKLLKILNAIGEDNV